MAFLLRRSGIAQYAGQKPHYRVDHRQCGDLSAGQDEVAKAHLLDRAYAGGGVSFVINTVAAKLIPSAVEGALVDALEPAGEHGDAFGSRPAAGRGLIEGFSAG